MRQRMWRWIPSLLLHHKQREREREISQQYPQSQETVESSPLYLLFSPLILPSLPVPSSSFSLSPSSSSSRSSLSSYNLSSFLVLLSRSTRATGLKETGSQQQEGQWEERNVIQPQKYAREREGMRQSKYGNQFLLQSLLILLEKKEFSRHKTSQLQFNDLCIRSGCWCRRNTYTLFAASISLFVACNVRCITCLSLMSACFSSTSFLSSRFILDTGPWITWHTSKRNIPREHQGK